MDKLLIIQPGRFGDILICLPIAKWYAKDFDVEWLCSERFHPIFRNIDYCQPISDRKTGYKEILDLSFGIVMETEVEKWWKETREFLFSFVEGKYIQGGVALSERWNLSWKRNYEKENELLHIVVKKYGDDYNLVHEKSEGRFERNILVDKKVIFAPIKGFNIFDWYLVIKHAKAIHCIDSVLCNFVEVICEWKQPKFYYDNAKDPQWNKTIIRNNWRIIK